MVIARTRGLRLCVGLLVWGAALAFGARQGSCRLITQATAEYGFPMRAPR
jgi:hypothetical protein